MAMTTQKEELQQRLDDFENGKKLGRAETRNFLLTELMVWLRGRKVKQCNCEEDDGLGYHTKECNMVALGINQEVEATITHLHSLKKNL